MFDRASDALDLVTGFVRYRSRQEPLPRAIFVLGTGRSGTHWVANILATHPALYVSIERRRFFRLSAKMAIDPRSREQLFGKLAQLYRYEMARVAPRHYADKSHTNIWIADALAQEFPDSLFIGVRRGVFATVSSMLRHRGVLQWIEDWKRYPIPNRFLGIKEGDEEWYERLPLAAKCPLRWMSHEERFVELGSILRERLLVLRYEQLHAEPALTLRALERAIGLPTPIAPPRTDHNALHRWRSELSKDEIDQVRSILDRSAVQ